MFTHLLGYTMRLKWLAFTFLLGLIVILDPTQTPAQFGQKGGGKGKRDFNGFNPGGNGPGAFTPGGGDNFPPGGGFNRPQGGGPGGWQGGPGGGQGGPRMSPDAAWGMLLSRANLPANSDIVDLNQLPQTSRDFLSRMMTLPEGGMLTRDTYISAFAAMSETRGRNQMGQNGPTQVFIMPGGGGPGRMQGYDPTYGGGQDGWDNPGSSEKGSRDRRNDKKDVEDEKPVAIRYGKLPPGLPEWFEEFDIDKDGQVALWEWRKFGRLISDFDDYDLNKDGLITADELIRWQQLKLENEHDAAIANGERPRPTQTAGGRGSGNSRERGQGGARGDDPQKTGTAAADADPSEKGNPETAAPEKGTPEKGPPMGRPAGKGKGGDRPRGGDNGGGTRPEGGPPPRKGMN
jgi:hypothetical protein